MSYILGMDLGVFLAWIGTLLATVLCIIYGLYYQFVKKPEKTTQPNSLNEGEKKEEEIV